jgi:hypothetical protein
MTEDRYTAFASGRLLASGSPEQAAAAAGAALAADQPGVLIFDDATGEQVEIDPFARSPAIAGRGSSAPLERPGRGRPKLGVVAREVTLLPRHWAWLAAQPGGASAALRRLVEAASRQSPAQARRTQEAVYRVMTALAGDAPAYEEAVRALFSAADERFDAVIANWLPDVRDYVARLARAAREARAAG